MPVFSSPTSQPLLESKLSTQVGEPCMPILSSIPDIDVPFISLESSSPSLRYFGTRNSEIPLEPSGASGSLARTM